MGKDNHFSCSDGSNAVRATPAGRIPLDGFCPIFLSRLGAQLSNWFAHGTVPTRVRVLIQSALWYLPAVYIASVGITALFSPRAALWLILAGALFLAGGLVFMARLIRQRYRALLARLPKIDGQAPKRLEVHAVIMGVGEAPANDGIGYMRGEDAIGDVDDELNDELDDAEDGKQAAETEAIAEARKDAAISDEEMSDFEIFEVPMVRRDRNRKPVIH